MKNIILAAAIATTLAGCASNTYDVGAVYKAPSTYNQLNCTGLEFVYEQKSQTVYNVFKKQNRKAIGDKVAVVAALVNPIAAGYTLTADEHYQVSTLKGDLVAINFAADEKGCDSITDHYASFVGQEQSLRDRDETFIAKVKGSFGKLFDDSDESRTVPVEVKEDEAIELPATDLVASN